MCQTTKTEIRGGDNKLTGAFHMLTQSERVPRRTFSLFKVKTEQ